MATDYISREAAIDHIKRQQCQKCSDIGLCGNCAVLVAMKLLETVPSADVEPVRPVGRWVNKKGGFFEFATCSVCGEKHPTAGITPNYCSSCGAKMDLGGNTSDS